MSFSQVRTPIHPMPQDQEYLRAVREVCRQVLYGWWSERGIPMKIQAGCWQAKERIYSKKAWGEWAFEKIPNNDTLARRFNELADPRLDWAEELPSEPFVQPAIGLKDGYYVPNPLRFDIGSEAAGKLKKIVEERGKAGDVRESQ